MKILIAYYSFSGKTESLAQSLSRYLKDKKHSVELERIEPVKKYSFITALIFGCRDAMTKAKPAIIPPKIDSSKFDCIAVLSPSWAGTNAPPVTTYISLLPQAKKGQFAISGATGSDSSKTAKGISNLLSAKGYPLAGELCVKAEPSLPPEDELRRQFSLLEL